MKKKMVLFWGVVLLLIVIKLIYCIFISHEYIYIEDSSRSKFVRASEIEELYLSEPKDSTIAHLKYCRNLRKLSIVVSQEKDLGNINFLSDLNLTSLFLSGTWNDYSGIQTQSNLKELGIHCDNFTSDDIKYLVKLDKLEITDIHVLCYDLDISNFDKLENLKHLNLFALGIKGSESLLDCTKLESVVCVNLSEEIVLLLKNKGVHVNDDDCLF